MRHHAPSTPPAPRCRRVASKRYPASHRDLTLSFAFVLSLVLQAIAVIVVFTHVRERRSGHLGVILLMVLVVFHGVAEVLQRLYPALATYRTRVSMSDVDQFLPYVGAAILAYGVVYASAIGREQTEATTVHDWWPSWKLVLIASIPMWLVAAGAATLKESSIHYWGGGIASQFLIITSGLTTVLYVAESERPHLTLALLLQSLALSFLGERSGVVAAGLMVLWGLALVGYHVRKRTIFALVGLLALFALIISAARVDVGRQPFTEGQAVARLSGLAQGFSALRQGHSTGLGRDFIYRIDGNAWPALVLERQQSTPLASPTGIIYDLLITIPHAFYPAKLDRPLTQRQEEYFFDVHYGIPTSESTGIRGLDWLPTLLGSALAYSGPFGMIVFAAFAGFLLARIDRRLLERTSFTSLLVGLGIVAILVGYEGGFDSVALEARGVFVVWLAVRAVLAIRSGGGSNSPGALVRLATQPAPPSIRRVP